MTPFIKQTPKVSVRKYGKYVYPYLDIWHDGQRTRLHMGCKVLGSHWCKEKQRAYISPILSDIDNYNNGLVNEQIDAFISRYMAFIEYICKSNKFDNFNAEIIDYMARPPKIQQAETLNVFKIIEDAITNNTLLNERVARNNYIGKGIKSLRAFVSYREEPLRSFEEFTPDFIDEYVEFLAGGNYLNNGKPYAMASLNSIIKYAVSAIKCAPTQYLSKAQAQTIPTPQLTNKTAPNNEIALRDKEVIKLWNYIPKSKRDEEIRDMFLLLCLTGQRVSDLANIEGGICEIEGIACMRIVQQKCSHKLANDIVFPIAIEILKKYPNLPISDIGKKINNNIGRIAKDAGIDGIEQVSKHYQGSDKPQVTKVDRTSLIHSHTGRRTFVSILAVHGWSYEIIGKYTGQKSIKTVALYDKSTSIDRRIFEQSQPHERLQVVNEKPQQPIIPTATKPKHFPTSVEEAKEVLKFLGVETISNDIGELLGLISLHESYILDICKHKIDIITIKDLFNTDIPLDARCKALKIVIDGIKH